MTPTAPLLMCRLCRSPRVLQESHIVPEFLHRPVYDEDHEAIYFDSERMRQGTRRRGFWEEFGRKTTQVGGTSFENCVVSADCAFDVNAEA